MLRLLKKQQNIIQQLKTCNLELSKRIRNKYVLEDTKQKVPKQAFSKSKDLQMFDTIHEKIRENSHEAAHAVNTLIYDVNYLGHFIYNRR